MSKVISKKGISLVALVITIIVLIILTAAVVVTGINTPRNTEYAIKMHNHAAVQDAVTLYIMTSMLDGMDNYDPSTAGSYTVKDVDDIVPELYNISSKQWTTNAATKLGINLTQEELQAVFTLDSKGVVGWVSGQEPTRDEEGNNQQPTKTLSSIAISGTYDTEYTEGEKFNPSGIVVTATYSDGSTADITSSVTYTPTLDTELTKANTSITITYQGKTTTQEIVVAYPTDGRYYAAKGVNSPLLAEGMTAVYWNGTTEVTSANPGTDENFDYNSWYNYEAQTGATTNGGTSKWANAKTADGSYWVWIPRYAYSITSGYHTSTAGTIEVEFLKGKTNTSTTGRTEYAEAAGANNWNIHPAFYYDGTSTTGTQLAGIWVAKYEMSMETNGVVTITSSADIGNKSIVDNTNIKAVSKPGVTAWRYINSNNKFINALNYDTTSVSNANLDSHLMKNSEWGAVAYLGHSKYGRNATEIKINANSSYYTAGGNGATAHTNVLQSTTGNCYGIFDISGGSWEGTAAYMTVISATTTPGSNGASLINAASKYKDVYDTPDSTSDYSERNDVRVYGDGIWETSSACSIDASVTFNSSWYSNRSGFMLSAYPFMVRGGRGGVGATGFGALAYGPDIGEPEICDSYRVVLWGEITN